MRRFVHLFAAVLLAGIACDRRSDKADGAGDAAPEATFALLRGDAEDPRATDAAAALPPLPMQPPFADLPVPGFPDAVVSLPNGAMSACPVLIVLHGSGEKPDRSCDMWRQMTRARGFVVCPRDEEDADPATGGGARRPPRRGGVALRSFVDVLLDALGTRYAGYVNGQRPVVVGSSMVAGEVAELAANDSRRFPRIALLEGGNDVWSKERIHAFHWEGGDRVLFACASVACLPNARAAARNLERAGVESHVVHAEAKRTNDESMQAAILDEMGWFLGDDARWGESGRRIP
jgi:poly(3-hydroxybutyrate) depolymerase